MTDRNEAFGEQAITLCMIVKNESASLERCLYAAKPFVSALVVLDTGSDDETAALACEHGALVVPFAWNGHFGEARNAALAHVRTPWALVLDADEEVVGWDTGQVSALLADPEIAGLYVCLRNYSEPPPGGRYETDSAVRLFRPLPGAAYRGRVHEDISQSLLERYPHKRLERAAVEIAHYGYALDEEGVLLKHERNVGLLMLAIEEEPEEPYYVYALGTEYFLRGEYAKAADWLEKAAGRLPPNAGYAADCFYKLAYALYRSGEFQRALHAADAGAARFAGYADLIELRAVLLLESGRIEQAYRRLTEAARERGTERAERAGIDYLRGVAAERLFNFTEAAASYSRALQAEPRMEAAYSRLLDVRFALSLTKGRADASCLWPPEPDEDGREAERKAVLQIVRDLIESHDAIDEERKWRTFFLHALKWGLGGHVLQLAAIMGDEKSHPELAYLQAICCAQRGETKAAVRLLNGLGPAGERSGLQLVLYRWAALHAEYERSGAGSLVVLDLLNEQKGRYPELGPLVDALLRAEKPALDERLYERAAFALLLMGAWSAFGYLFEKCGGGFRRLLPRAWYPSLLRAPQSIQRLVAESAFTRHEALAFDEKVVSAVLAGLSGRSAEPAGSLASLSARYPERIEPRIGLHAVLSRSSAAALSLALCEP